MTNEEFKKIRLDAGLTQKQLGNLIHRELRMVNYYESDRMIEPLVIKEMRRLEKKNKSKKVVDSKSD